MSSMEDHLRKLKVRYFDMIHSKPKCCVKYCTGRVLSGTNRYGHRWQSKYCRKHAKNKLKYAKLQNSPADNAGD